MIGLDFLHRMMRRPVVDETPAIPARPAEEPCGASLSARCFHGSIGCPVHRVYSPAVPSTPEAAPVLTGAALAWAALDHIQARPEEHDPLVFIARSGHGPLVAGFDGRVCLLAGDAAMFDRSERETVRVVTPDRAPWRVFDRAAHLLGISSDHLLIAAPPSARDLPGLVGETFGPRPGGAA